MLARSVALLTRGVVGALRQVAAVFVAVAVQLAFDRRRAAAQLVGDGAHRAAQPQQISDLQAFPQRQISSRAWHCALSGHGLAAVASPDLTTGASGHAEDLAGGRVGHPGTHQLPILRVADLDI